VGLSILPALCDLGFQKDAKLALIRKEDVGPPLSNRTLFFFRPGKTLQQSSMVVKQRLKIFYFAYNEPL
jgi:hypothetical protein